MNRSRKVLVLCHCLLNANAKVHPLATYAGVLDLIWTRFASQGVGLFQLPCPEASFLGLSRWGMTSEQYDHPVFRRHCRQILEASLDQLEALHRDGCDLVGVVGLDGSPSCGMFRTCRGFLGGEICTTETDVKGQTESVATVSGRGIFMQEFLALLTERGLAIPFLAVDEEAPGNIKTA